MDASRDVDVVASNVWKSYGDGTAHVHHAVRDVSLTVRAGEYVALMGPSGSGKSSLLHLLGALDVPSKGRVTYGDEDLGTLSQKELARLRSRHVGFVFQAYNLVPRLTSLQNVMLPTRFSRDGKGRDARADATRILESVGLGGKLKNAPSQLSGGERQRVAIARALVNDPRVVFADEPTGNLDSKAGEEILGILDGLHAEGRTIVLVTHDDKVGARAERILRMLDGRLQEAS